MAGWATATSAGVGLFGDGEESPEVDLHRSDVVPAVVIKRTNPRSVSADVIGWDAIGERRRAALANGLMTASRRWAHVSDRANALLVPEGSL